jgi:hypothetical protein
MDNGKVLKFKEGLGLNISSVTRLGKILAIRLLLLSQFSPEQAVSSHGLFEDFKSKIWRFWANRIMDHLHLRISLAILH